VKEAAMENRTETTLPPPPAPSKKRRAWPWIVLGIFIVLVVQAIPTATNPPTTSAPGVGTALEEPSYEFQIGAARLAWDTELTSAERSNICDYYNTPPVGTTSEMVEAFAEGAEMSYVDADRILDQLLAEKC
jgi:hypothetical protein